MARAAAGIIPEGAAVEEIEEVWTTQLGVGVEVEGSGGGGGGGGSGVLGVRERLMLRSGRSS